jgi:hypothetical protein
VSDAVAKNVIRAVAAVNAFWTWVVIVDLHHEKRVILACAIAAGLGVSRGGVAKHVVYHGGLWNLFGTVFGALPSVWDKHREHRWFSAGLLNTEVLALLTQVHTHRVGSANTHIAMALCKFIDMYVSGSLFHPVRRGASTLRLDAAQEHLHINAVLGTLASVAAVRLKRCTIADGTPQQAFLLERALAALAVFHLVRGRKRAVIKKGARVVLLCTAPAKGGITRGDVGTVDQDDSKDPWVCWDGKGREYFDLEHLAPL